VGDDQVRGPIRRYALSLWDDGIREERAGWGDGVQVQGLVRTVRGHPDRERATGIGVDATEIKPSGRWFWFSQSTYSLTLEPPVYNQLLIATSHLDYTPETRATQFASAISTLSAAPASVFCGDTNINTYPELEPLLSAGYVDSWLDTHPDFANSSDLREVGVTFGIAGLREASSSIGPEGPPRRLDYVMARGMKVKKCELVGGEQILKEKWATGPEEQRLDLEVYVSDHLGVLVDVELV